MMDTTWPERIVFGHAWVKHRNGRQTGTRERKIEQGFRPATQAGENVSRRILIREVLTMLERPNDRARCVCVRFDFPEIDQVGR